MAEPVLLEHYRGYAIFLDNGKYFHAKIDTLNCWNTREQVEWSVDSEIEREKEKKAPRELTFYRGFVINEYGDGSYSATDAIIEVTEDLPTVQQRIDALIASRDDGPRVDRKEQLEREHSQTVRELIDTERGA